VKGVSDTAELKEEIQRLVRDIVMIRDGGCIPRDESGVPACSGFRRDGEQILQADHLITRANSATYADTRLIVCVCKGHHGWKHWHEREYNAFLKEQVLSPEIVALWERCERDSWKPVRTGAAVDVPGEDVVRNLADRFLHRKRNVVGNGDRAGFVRFYVVVDLGVKTLHALSVPRR
jgi:hypothetical protein